MAKVLGLCLLVLAGCSLVQSEISDSPGSLQGTAYYYLPKAKLRLQLKKSGNDYSLEFVEPLLLVPDASELMVLTYQASPLSNDAITVKVSPAGLLQSVETTTEDKTGEIILKLIEAGKEAAQAITYVAAVGKVVGDYTVAPEDLAVLSEEILKDSEGQISVRLNPDPLAVALPPQDGRASGICFRPRRPYDLEIRQRGALRLRRTVLLPHGTPRLCLPITRAAFVKKVANLKFEQGVLTEVHLEKPSELLGLAEIPLSIAKAIALVPAELVKLRIDYSSKQKKLLEAEKSQLEAKQALLEYLDELRNKTQGLEGRGSGDPLTDY